MSPKKPNSLYPEVIQTNPESVPNFHSNPPDPSSPSLYPKIVVEDFTENLFPDHNVHSPNSGAPSAPVESDEEILIDIPGAIAHLIDKQYSVELACGALTIIRLRQGNNTVAVLARIGDQIQWPLGKDIAAVKLDDSHYFFSLRVPMEDESSSSDDEDKDKDKPKNESENLLNYGVTFASKGQEHLLKELDKILKKYSCFSKQKVSKKVEVLDGSAATEISPAELESEDNMKMLEETSAAFWTTLAPNVEDYSGCIAKVIAAGSGKLIQGILWCGDVTVERLNWGNEFLMKKTAPCSEHTEVSPETLKKIKRVKKISRMSEKVAVGILSGVVKVSGYFTSSLVNSRAGKKFFDLLPGEVVLASLDGFGRICDAVEVAGKNVMSTSSVVTTGLVSHRYGDKVAEATNEGLDAAGHAAGAAWAVFKLRKALDPKSAIKPTTLGKSAIKAAAKDMKAKVQK